MSNEAALTEHTRKLALDAANACCELAPNSPRMFAFRDAIADGASIELATKLAMKLPHVAGDNLAAIGNAKPAATAEEKRASREADLKAAAGSVNRSRGSRKGA